MSGEILREALAALHHAWPLLVGLGAGGLLLLLWEREAGRWRRATYRLLLIGGIALGLWQAWRILWLADDAFISFRYARNFARGWGLVYNEGEWVEGYTNFLWTLGLGLAGKLGLDIPRTALFGNLACYLGAILLSARVAARLAPSRPAIPFAALALALAKPFYTFAASGLETMALALLAIAAVALSFRRRGELAAGLALTAAVLCRPDQILLYVAFGIALVAEDLRFGEGSLRERLRPRRYLALAAPFLLIYLPYFFLRWNAYGALLPNTFYAKSGGAAYWSQGLVYLTHFLTTTGAWFWLPLFLVSIFVPARRRKVFRLRVVACGAAALLGAYVIRVGGDFMEFRFFVPLLPLIAVSTEVGLRHLPLVRKPRLLPAATWACALALALAWTPVRIVKPFEIRWHLAAEETFYQVGSLWPLRIENWHFEAGERLFRSLTGRGIRPKIAAGSIGMLGYVSDLPLFDLMGLTSRTVGKKAIPHRGRPGHEKVANLRDVLDAGVLIDLAPAYGLRWEAKTRVSVDGYAFHLVRYDPRLVKRLRAIPGAELPDPRRDLHALLARATRSELLEAHRFYALFLEGAPMRAEVLDRIRGRLAAVADFEEEEIPASWSAQGPFRILQERLPEGASGWGYLSSRGVEGRGELRIPLRIEAETLRLAIGGPASPRLGVELIVAGKLRERLHPRGTPGLSPLAFDTSEALGEEAELRIFDDDARAEVGIEVDAIHFAAREGDLVDRFAAGDPLGPLVWEAERSLPEGHPLRAHLEARVAERHRFDDELPEGSTVEGRAFGEGPAPGKLPGQQALVGQRGPGLLNGFHGGDEAVGRILLPWRRFDGRPIHLLVGGGPDCARVYVGLEVEGEIVARACGAADEALRPAELPTEGYEGRRGRIVVVDESREVWGHILVDDVIFESGPELRAPRAPE